MADKSLAKYRAKRDLSKTAEPSGGAEVRQAKNYVSSSRSMRRRICTTTCGWSSTGNSSLGPCGRKLRTVSGWELSRSKRWCRNNRWLVF
jgi:hypothetical protein